MLSTPTVVSLLALFVQDAVQRAPDVNAKITKRCQALLDEVHSKSRFAGGSAALVLPDGAEITITVGVTDREGGRKLVPKDRLLSGSIGKTYVAAAALQLATAKKLDLDAKAATYFEGADWFGKLAGADKVTVRQLLCHQSGLARYVFVRRFWKDLVADPDRKWQPRDMLSYVFGKKGMFEPGKGWAYSDTNYIVVGMIIERVSGVPFYEYVDKHFLKPHGLRDTVPSDRRRVEGLIQGHSSLFKAFGVPERVLTDGVFVFNPGFEWCGGGYCNTPADLARWARILYSGKAFKGDYLAEMCKTVAADPRYFGPGGRYGPGCIERRTKLGKLLGHDGVFPGYQSIMGWFPEKKIAVAFQINEDGGRSISMPLDEVVVELATIASEELKK